MKERNYLVKNIGLLTIGQFGTKLLSFFLVPLYTNILSTAEYGTYDLNVTTVSLLVPILTFNIADSLLRFPFDEKENYPQIFSIGLFYQITGTLLFAAALIANYVFSFSLVLNDYALMLFLLYAVTSLSGILINFCRGIDRVREVAISGVICSAVLIALNILFLVFLKQGLKGYFLANIIGIFSQSIYIFFALRLWKYISLSRINRKLEKEMVEYGRPLLINNISWWISSASDRYVVTWLCGIAANGVYSVGYKIPSILNIFQTIFGQAWTLSAIHDFDSEDKNGFFKNTYNCYNFYMTIVCSVLIILSRIIASLLYAKNFFEAWKYVPFLLIAIVFGALSGYMGGIFAAVKDTKVFAKSSIVGAVLNMVLNFILVGFIGPLGAAISTTLSYLLTWGLRILFVKKYMHLELNLIRDIFAYIVLIAQTVLLYTMEDSIFLYFLELTLFFILLGVFWKEIKDIMLIIKEKMVRY